MAAAIMQTGHSDDDGKRGHKNCKSNLTLINSHIVLTPTYNHDLKGAFYTSVSQPPGRGPVPASGINYTGPREILLEFVILIF